MWMHQYLIGWKFKNLLGADYNSFKEKKGSIMHMAALFDLVHLLFNFHPRYSVHLRHSCQETISHLFNIAKLQSKIIDIELFIFIILTTTKQQML
jgi:hypothetical protein